MWVKNHKKINKMQENFQKGVAKFAISAIMGVLNEGNASYAGSKAFS